MSNSTTNSGTNTFSEAKARDIMGKINDDFNTIASRGFEYLQQHPGWLDKHREDILYILLHQDLNTFQIQFKYNGGEKAVEYTVKNDYTIHSNRESGGINYFQIPRDAEVIIVIRRHNNPEVWKELQRRGWVTGARMIEGTETNKGAYSKDGFGAEIKLIGSWGK